MINCMFEIIELNIVLLKGKEEVELDSHLWLFPSSEDNIGLHFNSATSICY